MLHSHRFRSIGLVHRSNSISNDPTVQYPECTLPFEKMLILCTARSPTRQIILKSPKLAMKLGKVYVDPPNPPPTVVLVPHNLIGMHLLTVHPAKSPFPRAVLCVTPFFPGQ